MKCMFFPRSIYPSLKEHLKNKQMTVITGMRRTGKTTLVKQLIEETGSKNKLYLDLERIDNRELFSQANYDSVIRALEQRGLNPKEKVYLALDELQLAPNLPSVLKYLYDHYDVKCIVTGSSSYYLKNLFSESLAGRKKVFELFPLNFGEFLTFKGVTWSKQEKLPSAFNHAEYERVKTYYEEYIQYGGFPEVVLASNVQDKKDLLADIISSYINIDIKTLADFRSQEHIYNLMKMLAARAATRLDHSKLSRLTGISRPTVINYLDFLEKTYLITRLHVIAKRPDREIVKAKKVYICDNGIMNTLADVSSGVKFENAVFNQLRHYGELSYYSLKIGREIDFILDGKTAFEVKESPITPDKQALDELAKQAEIPQAHLVGRAAVPRFEDYIWGGEIR